MKTLHITNNYPTTNSPIFGIFVKEQIESLSNIGIENEVFFINGREKGKIEYIKSIFRIRKHLSKNYFDVIHCHHALSAICLILSGKVKMNRTVVSFQNDPSNEQGKLVFNFILERFAAVIIKNNSNLGLNSKVHYLPNGVNTKIFSPCKRSIACQRLGLDESKIYILFVSSNFIRKQKRYDIYKKTIQILKNEYQLDNIEELKLINTKRELVPYYFNAASLHLLTSDFEGSPNSVKEALACNTPVVSTNVGNVTDILKNVKGTFISKSNSPKELARLSHLVLSDEKEHNLNQSIIEKKLDINSKAIELKEIYNSIQ
nr:glycosyltransferase family 4 protein [uncultured Draconibacterium sp.]